MLIIFYTGKETDGIHCSVSSCSGDHEPMESIDNTSSCSCNHNVEEEKDNSENTLRSSN